MVAIVRDARELGLEALLGADGGGELLLEVGDLVVDVAGVGIEATGLRLEPSLLWAQPTWRALRCPRPPAAAARGLSSVGG